MAAFVHVLEQSSKAVLCAHMCMCSQVVSPPDLITAFQHNTTSRSLSIRIVSPWGIVQIRTVTVRSVPRSLTLQYLFSDCLLHCSDPSIIFSLCDEFCVCHTTNFVAFLVSVLLQALVGHFSKEPSFIFPRKAS